MMNLKTRYFCLLKIERNCCYKKVFVFVWLLDGMSMHCCCFVPLLKLQNTPSLLLIERFFFSLMFLPVIYHRLVGFKLIYVFWDIINIALQCYSCTSNRQCTRLDDYSCMGGIDRPGICCTEDFLLFLDTHVCL